MAISNKELLLLRSVPLIMCFGEQDVHSERRRSRDLGDILI
jgi:hypothetical protein